MEELELIKEKIRNKLKNKDDKLIVYYILDKIKESKENNKVIYTNFYNLAEISLIKEYIKYNNMYISGGLEYNERNILVIYPDKKSDINIKSEIQVLNIEFNKYQKDINISHRDVLGSILSLGINRNLLGDIFVNENDAYVIVKKNICKYIIDNIKVVKNTKVNTYISDFDSIELNSDKGRLDTILINSLRIDNILSSSLKISRSKTEEMLNQNIVYVNWKQERKKDILIKIDDVISIRKYGRIVINNICGVTKKGRIKVEIKRYM